MKRVLLLKQKRGRIKYFFFCMKNDRWMKLKALEGGIWKILSRFKEDFLLLLLLQWMFTMNMDCPVVSERVCFGSIKAKGI